MIHPGVILYEELHCRHMTQAELAMQIGRPAQVVSEIINGKKSITPETALQLEKALEISAEFWCHLQVNYDLERARNANTR